MKIELLVSQEWLAAVDAEAERMQVKRNAAVVNMVWGTLLEGAPAVKNVKVNVTAERQ